MNLDIKLDISFINNQTSKFAIRIYHSTQLRLFSIAFRHPCILLSIPSRSIVPWNLPITPPSNISLLLDLPLTLDILQRLPISNSQSSSKASSKSSCLCHLRNNNVGIANVSLELHQKLDSSKKIH